MAYQPKEMTDKQWNIIVGAHKKGHLDDDSFANIAAARERGEATTRDASQLINTFADKLGMKPIDHRTREQKAEAPVETEQPTPTPTNEPLPEREPGEMENRIAVKAALNGKTAWFKFPMTAKELNDAIKEAFAADAADGDLHSQVASREIVYKHIEIVAADPRGMIAEIGYTPSQQDSLSDINLLALACRENDAFLSPAEKREAIKLALSVREASSTAVEVASIAYNAGPTLPYTAYDKEVLDALLAENPQASAAERYGMSKWPRSDFGALPPGGYEGMVKSAASREAADGLVELGAGGYVLTGPDSRARELIDAAASAYGREALAAGLEAPYAQQKADIARYVDMAHPSDKETFQMLAAAADSFPLDADRHIENMETMLAFDGKGPRSGPAASPSQVTPPIPNAPGHDAPTPARSR